MTICRSLTLALVRNATKHVSRYPLKAMKVVNKSIMAILLQRIHVWNRIKYTSYLDSNIKQFNKYILFEQRKCDFFHCI